MFGSTKEDREMVPYDLVKYVPQTIPIEFVHALSTLVTECEKEKVEIKEVKFYMTGFQVMFAKMPGDAICHEGSHAHTYGMWETAGMPWDYGDVSVHSAETLTLLIKEYLAGGDWESVAKNL